MKKIIITLFFGFIIVAAVTAADIYKIPAERNELIARNALWPDVEEDAGNTNVVPVEIFGMQEAANFNGKFGDMINGSGMNGLGEAGDPSWPTNAPTAWLATSTSYQMEWQSKNHLDTNTSVNAKVGWVVADYGAVGAFDKWYIWNVRETSARAVQTFNVYYADTPTVTVVHGPSNNDPSIDYDFSSGGWTKLNPSPLTIAFRSSGGVVDAIVDLTGVNARYLAIEILTWGGDASRVGLAEFGITRP